MNPPLRLEGGEEAGLSEVEQIGLRWAVRCNARNVGYLGPTVRRRGPLSEYDRLVRDGLLQLIDSTASTRALEAYGYWITKTGRAALAALNEGKA